MCGGSWVPNHQCSRTNAVEDNVQVTMQMSRTILCVQRQDYPGHQASNNSIAIKHLSVPRRIGQDKHRKKKDKDKERRRHACLLAHLKRRRTNISIACLLAWCLHHRRSACMHAMLQDLQDMHTHAYLLAWFLPYLKRRRTNVIRIDFFFTCLLGCLSAL